MISIMVIMELFLLCKNIELYVKTIIVYCKTHSVAVIDKILSLSWGMKVEQRECTNIVRTASIKTSIKEQQQLNYTYKLALYSKVDPHKKIKEVFSYSQNLDIIKQIWAHNRKYSNEIHFAYCQGTSNRVHGARFHAMQFH
jgi:hypothetical protein